MNAKKAHQGTDALQRSPKVRHDDAPQSDRRRTDAPQSVHNLTEVSKNAFVEPFSAPQNYVANYPKELTHTTK